MQQKINFQNHAEAPHLAQAGSSNGDASISPTSPSSAATTASPPSATIRARPARLTKGTAAARTPPTSFASQRPPAQTTSRIDGAQQTQGNAKKARNPQATSNSVSTRSWADQMEEHDARFVAESSTRGRSTVLNKPGKF